MTIKLSVVGSPIDHSLSPILHTAAYELLELDYGYEKNQVEKGGLATFAATQKFQALSVTMPLKQEAYALSTVKSEAAKLTQVVNSLVFSHGKWIGENTDVFGLAKVLSSVENLEKILLIGSGATTRSALLAIASTAPDSTVGISARNHDALTDVLEFAESLGLSASAEDLSNQAMADASLVMSLVPSGALHLVWDDFAASGKTPKGKLFDVSYLPWPSEAAEAWGNSNAISGIEMLIWQAIAQVRFFAKHLGSTVTIQDQALYKAMSDTLSNR